MNIEKTPLNDVIVISPRVFKDDRGYFFESFNANDVAGTELAKYNWIQENESKSTKGVLRGLHFQKGSYAQAKLVRVIIGEVYDVAVDLRTDSSSFGKWHAEFLTGDNKKQFLVPRGFAHGFLVLSDMAIFSYKCDNFYSPQHDSGIIYNDQDLEIKWPDTGAEYQCSDKDKNLDSFSKAYKF